VDLVARKLRKGAPRERAADVPVAGGDLLDFDRFVDEQLRARPAPVPAESIEPLLRSHGTGALRLLERVRTEPALGRPVHEGSPVLAVQVLHAAQAEMAEHLDDVVLRRTELWLGAGDPVPVVERCAQLVAGPLGWDGARERAEVRRALEAFAR
jgi:glycerol-3-phosphate dehydrogenase